MQENQVLKEILRVLLRWPEMRDLLPVLGLQQLRANGCEGMIFIIFKFHPVSVNTFLVLIFKWFWIKILILVLILNGF